MISPWKCSWRSCHSLVFLYLCIPSTMWISDFYFIVRFIHFCHSTSYLLFWQLNYLLYILNGQFRLRVIVSIWPSLKKNTLPSLFPAPASLYTHARTRMTFNHSRLAVDRTWCGGCAIARLCRCGGRAYCLVIILLAYTHTHTYSFIIITIGVCDIAKNFNDRLTINR